MFWEAAHSIQEYVDFLNGDGMRDEHDDIARSIPVKHDGDGEVECNF